ncbi:hypothetical protein ACA910_016230 [Epithemia clementina (nom. ined.)]
MDSTKQELASLDVQRRALEEEAQSITAKLTSPTGDDGTGPPMGIDTPLVDIDGYPRSDIDLYLVRSLRKRLAELRTDHKQVMNEIEKRLLLLNSTNNDNGQPPIPEEQARMAPKPKPKYDPVSGKWVVKNWDGTISGAGEGNGDGTRAFDSIDSNATPPPVATLSNLSAVAQPRSPPPTTPPTPASTPTTTTTTTSATLQQQQQQPPPPFARVDAVALHSPASLAGLQEDDLILQFGSITKPSCLAKAVDPFQEVATLVPIAAGEQQTITILVQRQQQGGDDSNHGNGSSTVVHSLQLTPKPWDGRGLLGCHIVPV